MCHGLFSDWQVKKYFKYQSIIVKNFSSKKLWQIPSYERFGKKTLAVGIIIAKSFTTNFLFSS